MAFTPTGYTPGSYTPNTQRRWLMGYAVGFRFFLRPGGPIKRPGLTPWIGGIRICFPWGDVTGLKDLRTWQGQFRLCAGCRNSQGVIRPWTRTGHCWLKSSRKLLSRKVRQENLVHLQHHHHPDEGLRCFFLARRNLTLKNLKDRVKEASHQNRSWAGHVCRFADLCSNATQS